jgi:hypothetical protein
MDAVAVRMDLRPARLRAACTLLGVFLAAVAGGWYLAHPGTVRPALAATISILLIALGLVAPRTVLLILIVWLAALGFTRRVMSDLGGTPDTDPLLLIAPATLAVLALVAARYGAFRNLTLLSHSVLTLGVLTVIGALNPLQGSVKAGVGGLLFLFVPLLAFWIGRTIPEQTLASLFWAIAILAVPTAVYGLAQTFSGLPSWDANWVRESDFNALTVYAEGGTSYALRPFSTFSSPAEYGYFLAIGIIAWFTFGLRRELAIPAAAASGLLAVALLYQSSRGIVFTLVGAIALITAARHRLAAVPAAVLLVAAVVSVPFVIEALAPRDTSALVAHQVEGLSDPFNPEQSTLIGHLGIMLNGVTTAFSHPLGLGTSAVTLAGDRLGGARAQGTDADPSNIAVALGLPALVVYLVIVGVGLVRAYQTAVRRRDALSLAALGVLVTLFAQWMNGGQYAVAFLPWLMLGWLDRPPSTD